MRDRVAELLDSLIEDVSGSANRPSAEEIVERLKAIKAAREEIIIGVPEAPTPFAAPFQLNQPITATHPRAMSTSEALDEAAYAADDHSDDEPAAEPLNEA